MATGDGLVRSPDLDALQERIGYRFRQPEHLRHALIHTSYVNEVVEPKPPSNERLEFLGDAAVGLIVAERLYRDRPDLHEGDLTTMRAAVVRLETLGRVGLEIGLGEYLFLGRGEESTGGRRRATVVGRALEALIGAVYVDGGLDAVRDLTVRLIDDEVRRASEHHALKDDKSRLQELAQGELSMTPSYRTVAAVGPDHAKEFTVEVSLGDAVIGRGRGRTKQSAAQSAAADALTHWPPDIKGAAVRTSTT